MHVLRNFRVFRRCVGLQELKADADRSRQLLHRLLPASIADDLKSDKAVPSITVRPIATDIAAWSVCLFLCVGHR